MITSSKVASNTLYLSLSSVLALCIALGFHAFLARMLGVERFGEFSFALSFISLFAVLVEFSLDSVIVRDVARDPAKAGTYFGNALVLKGLLFLVAIALVAIIASILGYPYKIRLLLYILSLGLLFDGVTKCCASLFHAAQRMRYPAALLVTERILFALLGLVAVSLHGSVIAIVVCYVAAQAMTQLASLVLVQRELRLKAERIEYGVCKGLARHASSFFAISLIAAAYADIDKLFLFSMQGEMAVGFYAAAYKLVTVPTRFSNAFHNAIYPVLAERAALPGRELLAETYQRSMRYLLFGAIPMAIGTTVFAEPIMRAIYGQAYVAGAIALQILIWAYVLEFFNPFFARVLFALDKQRFVLVAAIVGTVSNILLNIVLIPYYSFVGAAIATLVSASLILVLLLFAVRRVFPNVSLSAVTLKPALAGLGMAIVCILWQHIPFIPLALLGVLVYCGCLILTGAFSPEELLMLRRALRPSTWIVRR